MVWVWRRKIWPISGLFYPVLSHFQCEESWVLYAARNIHAYWMVWKCFGAMPWSLQGGNIVQGLKNADGTDKTECGIHIEYNIWSHRMSSSKSSLVCKAVQSKAYTICMRNVVLKCPSNKLHPFFCSTASTGCTIFGMRSSHFSPYLKLVNCTVCPAIVLPKCLHTCSDHCSH